MKDARPSIKTESSATVEGAPIVSLSAFPAKLDSVRAEVLRRMLSGERLTGIDAVFDASTTRLSAVVFALSNAYQWPIKSASRATGCKDGRVTYVAEYFLPPTVIAHAAARGAAQWCAKVRAARLKLRTNAAKAKRQADMMNRATAKRRHDAEQGALFGGA